MSLRPSDNLLLLNQELFLGCLRGIAERKLDKERKTIRGFGWLCEYLLM